MAMHPSVGLILANRAVVLGKVSVRDLIDLSTDAERSGVFDAVWVGDSLLAKPRLESVTLLSTLASVTTRVRLGVGCMSSGQILGPAERLSRLDALRALTTNGAWFGFAEQERGMLAPGKLADLAILDRDPLTAPLEALHELSCSLTMVGGRVIHSDA